MNNYYILTHKLTYPRFDAHFECLLADDSGIPSPNPFNQLESVKEPSFKLKVLPEDSEIGKTRDKLSVRIQNNEALLVFTEKLKNLLSQLNDDIEFHTVTLVQDGKELTGHYIANVLQQVNAIDIENSKLIFWDDSHELVYNIDELVLDASSIPKEYNIFLLGGMRDTPIFVISEKLKNLLEENEITGVDLCEPQDFMV